MSTTRFLINGVAFASLGLADPRIAYGSMQPDMVEVEHLTAAWDADPLFAYRQDIVITRDVDGVQTRVFRGVRRLAPRFAGGTAESMAYTIAGPWDWLEHRDLLQNQAVVIEEGDAPTLIPQGLIILNQDDTGNTINVAQALTIVIQAAIDAGVPITMGTIIGFDFAVAWDEMADLTIAAAITRLLQIAPDAIVWWDYTTINPTIHIGRRANLPAVNLPIAPRGKGGDAAYVPFEEVRLVDRPDMVPPGAWITFRSIDTIDGVPKLRIETDEASDGTAQRTDEGALNRTVQLAGSTFASSSLSQECVTALIPSALGRTPPLTPADGTDFTAVLNFFGRSEKWLLEDTTKVTKLTALLQFRRGLEPDPVSGQMVDVGVDPTLLREMVTGAVTPWMKEGGLNRKSQQQDASYEVEATRMIDGVKTPYNATVTRAFLATNANTRTYTYQESVDSVPAEPKPDGLVQSLYDAMKELQWEGTFVLLERVCSLNLRPGMVVNLTGRRAAWETMRAVIQSVNASLVTGRTTVVVGFSRPLGAGELTAIWRSNRVKKPAQNGLTRVSGLAL